MNGTTERNFTEVKRKLFDKLYSSLNERQKEAVYTVNGPLLVLAGAGTGKTTVLVNRIAHIIRYGDLYNCEEIPEGMTDEEVERLNGALNLSQEEIAQVLSDYVTKPCDPWNILCFTFTNKAANEMKVRLSKELGEEAADSIWAGTFHSICIRILRKFGESIGYNTHFTIYDTDDTKKTIKNCMAELEIDEKRFSVKTVVSQISNFKEKLMTPEDVRETSSNGYSETVIGNVYALYQKKLAEASALDFDDIIMQTVRLLDECKDAKDYCNNRFKYVSVDEFQDTNFAQLKLIEKLTEKRRNVMVVGDDDQSIYKFRGATIENILNFDKNYIDAHVVKLEENYRSTSNILDAANGIICNNIGRHSKQLFTSAGEGEKITVAECLTQIDEAKYIVSKIQELVLREKRKYSDFAVIYRMNAQSNIIESVMSRSGMPHRIIGGTRFYERKEVKDIVAYLSVISNTADTLRLNRIINEPKRKIGDKLVEDINAIADANGISAYEVIKDSDFYPQICKSSQKLKAFYDLIEELREIAKTENLQTLFEKTIELTGYRDMLMLDGNDGAERLNNMRELITNAVEYQKQNPEATLEGFLEEVALVNDIDNYDKDADAVILMTIHSAKGLEFPVVFIPGCEEGIFPSEMSIGEDNLEEERRLAYVAVTRAKHRLYCIHAHERMLYGKTSMNRVSRFVGEMPEENVNFESNSPIQTVRPKPLNTRNVVSSEFASATVEKYSAPQTNFERFKTGDRVKHMLFGGGTVMSVTELGADVLYEIAFDKVGTKKLMATFAKLKHE